MKKTLLLLFAAGFVLYGSAQDIATKPSPILFIYDASGSMWGQMQGKTKMEIAADVLSSSVSKLPENQKLGFVAYGHREKGDCKDVEFLVDVEQGTKSSVIEAVKGIQPLGKTPLAYSALLVIDKLRDTRMKATIILVTDGIESCGGNICDVIRAAKEEGLDFKLHIIGFGLKDSETEQLLCAAKAGGGNYYDAANAEGLGEVLDAATATSVDLPDGNVTVYAMKNGEPIDAYVKAYDVVAKRSPIASRTYKDTALFYLPPSTYNLEVRALGGSDVDKITVTGIKSTDDAVLHRTVSFDAGKLGITTTNNGEAWDCLVKLYGADGKVVAQTRTYTSIQDVEVNPGTYKVTIQALTRLEGIDTLVEFDAVEITAGSTTPVSHDFKSGQFEIYTKVGNENIDTVVKVKEVSTGTNVAGSRTYLKGTSFLLNPGQYQVNIKPLGVHKAKTAQNITIEVTQNETIIREVKF